MLSNFFILYLIFKTGLSLELGLDILGRLAGQQVTEICLPRPCPSAQGYRRAAFPWVLGSRLGCLCVCCNDVIHRVTQV